MLDIFLPASRPMVPLHTHAACRRARTVSHPWRPLRWSQGQWDGGGVGCRLRVVSRDDRMRCGVLWNSLYACSGRRAGCMDMNVCFERKITDVCWSVFRVGLLGTLNQELRGRLLPESGADRVSEARSSGRKVRPAYERQPEPEL